MYDLGFADGANDDANWRSGSDEPLDRAGQVGRMFLDMSDQKGARAEEYVASVRVGILRFIEWLGFGEPASFAAKLPAFAEELAEYEPGAGLRVDYDIARETDDALRALWAVQ